MFTKSDLGALTGLRQFLAVLGPTLALRGRNAPASGGAQSPLFTRTAAFGSGRRGWSALADAELSAYLPDLFVYLLLLDFVSDQRHR